MARTSTAAVLELPMPAWQRRIKVEYLQSLTQFERVCYAKYEAGATPTQIAGELFLSAEFVYRSLAAIGAELRMRLLP